MLDIPVLDDVVIIDYPPGTQAEMDRLLLIHEIITMSIGALYLAPLKAENMKRILDIGTGCGVCKGSFPLSPGINTKSCRVCPDW